LVPDFFILFFSGKKQLLALAIDATNSFQKCLLSRLVRLNILPS